MQLSTLVSITASMACVTASPLVERQTCDAPAATYCCGSIVSPTKPYDSLKDALKFQGLLGSGSTPALDALKNLDAETQVALQCKSLASSKACLKKEVCCRYTLVSGAFGVDCLET
ncbi:hypothetical protein LTR10_001841 [Elasticomyces elasticus]|nr:hypothetical protein LTR10_001841 [Elasticomyces elasticus]KAK4975339.1 hypothetical protein LTR42_004549 [Elasticomyces elasticus]